MHVIRHHEKLMEFKDWKPVWEMDKGFCYDFTDFRFLNTGAAWITKFNSRVSVYFTESFKRFLLLQDDMVDEGSEIIVCESTAMIGMQTGLFFRRNKRGGLVPFTRRQTF